MAVVIVVKTRTKVIVEMVNGVAMIGDGGWCGSDSSGKHYISEGYNSIGAATTSKILVIKVN